MGIARQQSLSERPANLHKPQRPRTCVCRLQRSTDDMPARKTGSKDPAEKWVLRCPCGASIYCP